MKPKKKWILSDTNSILRAKTSEVTFPLSEKELEYIEKMVCYVDASYFKTVNNIKPGIAIAANQIGLKKNIIYIHFDEKDVEHKYLLANPIIVSESPTYSYLPHGEGCLSVEENHAGIVKRKYKIVVKAKDLLHNNNDLTIEATGMLSICLQHEIDHLFGILYYDRINKENPFMVDEK
jgi:peptide deformylase